VLPLAAFGIESDALNTAVNVLILVLVVLWFALIFWTFADARRRIDDMMLVICATAASLFPFVGTIVYLIVRPPEFLDDVRLRELEMHAAEARVHELDHVLCPYCGQGVQNDFLRCPNCLSRLKEPCRSCRKPLDPLWQICPYCEAEVAPGITAASAKSAARRRRRSAESAATDR
jgi:hypothetical protein